ncbi:helix-turn-helix domain-containing protein [Thalassoglobus sp.]|uniref:helix-turn-helix domain-containing protein n=1 Tax=Thalassoglobus sp. TaxID=2795869 RepID=UPI003AA8C20B
MEKNLYTARQQKLLSLLRETRSRAGLRQEDVAIQLNRPQSFVSKYESGERRLDILELYDVCEVLGIKLSDFAMTLEKVLSVNGKAK